MKTTVIIDDALLCEAKQLAAAKGTTMSALIDQSLRAQLQSERTRQKLARPFALPVYGTTPSSQAGITVADLAELRDDGR